MGATEQAGPVRFRAVFAVAEFRALFAAQLVSVVGDQLARVALSILVYDRTRSPAWTAATYALTFLPDMVGGPLLSGLADRYPRRQVMVVADAARALLVAAMVPGFTPLWVVAVLVGVVQLGNTPWGAARVAVVAEMLTGERFVAGQAVFTTVTQTAQVVGFAAGGAIVAVLGARGGLAVDAVTFGLSAALVRFGVRPRPAAGGATVHAGSALVAWWGQVRDGAVLVWRTLRLRALIALACVSGIYIAAEALAAPYAADIGTGPVSVGLLFAAYPVGSVLGMLVLPRLPDAARTRSMVPMAVGACAVLIGCAWHPGLAWTLVLWTAGGVGAAYNLTASSTFVQSVPNAGRGQAFGLGVTAMRVTQGLGVVVSGVVAQHAPVHDVVAGAGVVGVLAAVGAGWWWRRATVTVTRAGVDQLDPR